MIVLGSVPAYREWRQQQTGSVGFVPTMGALHEGHLALAQASRDACDVTVVSIYVNPTQFNNATDLDNYPNTMDEDLRQLEALGVDAVFTPGYDDIYPDGFRYLVDENELSSSLCGAHRPGHFRGVLTVVMKLLNIVRPAKAFFGEKDYQQYELISGMAKAFYLDVEIVPCPTVRESDGLAMSSRNLNLDACSRNTAPRLFELLSSELSDEEVSRALTAEGFDVDYVVTRNGRRYGAATLGPASKPVRLIDNVAR